MSPQRLGRTLGATALLLLAACSGEASEPGGSGPAPSPTVAAPTTAATSTPQPSTPQPSISPAAGPALPDSCLDLVPTTAVLGAVARPLPGRPDYLFAGPLPQSGRTGRVTCGYGGGEPPAVEVSLLGYEDEETAAGRIELTVAAAQADGDRVTPQRVGGEGGFLLADPVKTSLVAAAGARTLVVSLRHGVVPEAAVPSALDEIATAVLAALPAGETPA